MNFHPLEFIHILISVGGNRRGVRVRCDLVRAERCDVIVVECVGFGAAGFSGETRLSYLKQYSPRFFV